MPGRIDMNDFFSSVKKYLASFLSEEKQSATPQFWMCLAGNIVLTLFFMNIFFWLLWTLLVYKGGIFVKVVPFFLVIFTSKTPRDFGYEGWPYELGIFDGILENFVALVLLVGFVIFCRAVYVKISRRASPGILTAGNKSSV